MKTMTNLGKATGVVLLFVGCGGNPQPKFSPNNKSIVFVEGQPYMIPRGTVNISQVKKTKGAEKFFNVVGCNKGDAAWTNQYYADAYDKAIVGKNLDEVTQITAAAARRGDIGCASPLSQQEYQYYVNQQNQAQANARAEKARSDAMWEDLKRQTAARNAQTNQIIQNTLNYTPYTGSTTSSKGYKTYDAYGRLVNSNDCYTTKDAYGRFVKTCK